jgi:hypothetical protein
MQLTIGQRVRHHDCQGRRVTGVVRGIALSADQVLEADIALDAPIVLPARGEGDREISIWRQHVSAHELTPFDARDELIAELRGALKAMLDHHDDVPKAAEQRLLDAGYAAVAKAEAFK